MADGDKLEIGKQNDSQKTTSLVRAASTVKPALIVQNSFGDSFRTDINPGGVGFHVEGTGTFGVISQLKGLGMKSAVVATVESGFGCLASSQKGTAVEARSDSGFGVDAKCPGGTALRATSASANAILASSEDGSALAASSAMSSAVVGHSSFGHGIEGTSFAPRESSFDPFKGGRADRPSSKAGVSGVSFDGAGVSGLSENHAGVLGSSNNGPAGLFYGDVVIVGGKVVLSGGTKSAAVPDGAGGHRLLFCIESPESWFEDFGAARLAKGRARVRIEKVFARTIRTNDYHVFLTPAGDSNGLYVARKGRKGFEVREQRGGRSSIAFSYRIVARRADVPRTRLPKFVVPAASRAETTSRSRILARTTPTVRPDAAAELLRSVRGKRAASGPRRKKR